MKRLAEHDALVVMVAALMLIGGAIAHAALAAPALVPFEEHGLRLSRPAGWLPGTPVEAPQSPLANLVGSAGSDAESKYHTSFQSTAGPLARVEIRVDRAPDFDGSLATWLTIDRRQQCGDAGYWTASSDTRTIAGVEWLRTEYRYVVTPADTAPAVATGIEYAAVAGDTLYAVTFHGDERQAREFETVSAPSLRIDGGTR